jgi:L-threonylcarbamoyladenylate synthase
LTVLLSRASRVPDVVTGGSDRVGLRVPSHPTALDLLDRFGGGVAAPSANRFGAVSPTTAAHVRADLGDDVDLILDGGPADVGVESTIVDCTTPDPEVLRPGGVSFEALTRVLGRPAAIWMGDRRVAAPGTLAVHYAPRAMVWLVDEPSAVEAATGRAIDEGKVVGVLAPEALEGLDPVVRRVPPTGDVDTYARVLYDRLRTADDLGIDVLVVVPPPDDGIGRAVRDRLRRAAANASDSR